MQVKSYAEFSKRAIWDILGAFCNTFDLHKLPFVFQTFVLSIFEWPHKTDFIVFLCNLKTIAMNVLKI